MPMWKNIHRPVKMRLTEHGSNIQRHKQITGKEEEKSKYGKGSNINWNETTLARHRTMCVIYVGK